MRSFLKYLLLAPIVLIFLSFDMANRQNVVISFDPFNSADAAALPQVSVPLFIVLMGSTMLGVLLGGIATWLGQSRFRKAAGEAKARIEALRRENESLRGQIRAKTPGTALAAPAVPTRNAA
ncbi:LapA family protein [uncultured Rhodoblastus sp.]|uniref:LapA family protein n=1 Tax=uncultured Rhodoblastus sp. TaxID=543037 RepID=UPI0025D6FA7F|nr:LapA family protein [uncultured Rhodoblastus sp.]